MEFTDGGTNTLTDASALFQTFFSFATDGSGAIDHWVIGIITADQSAQLDSDSPDPNGNVFDQSGFAFVQFAGNLNAPGTWTTM